MQAVPIGAAVAPRSKSTGLVVALVASGLVGMSAMGAFFLVRGGSSFGETALSLDPRVAPPMQKPAPVLAASFWSVPVLSEDGASLFAIVRADGAAANEVVVLDAASGAVRARAEVPAGLALRTFERPTDWERDNIKVTEIVPRAPFGTAFAGGALFAFAREWLVVDQKGAVRSKGVLPASVPAASARAGVCKLGSDAWLGVEDPRGGGVRIGADGTQDPTRIDAPPSCGYPIVGNFGQRWSRAQQLHAAPAGRELSTCMRTKHRASRATNQCEGYYGEGPSGELVGNLHSRLMLESGIYSFDAPIGKNTNVFNSLRGLEVAADRTVFVSVEASYDETTIVTPPKGSFEAPKQTKGWMHRSAIVAIDPKGKVRWQVSGGGVPEIYDSSLMIATPPRASHATLYLYRPGSLVAVDQQNGRPRFVVAPR